jgi:hypothetical protein
MLLFFLFLAALGIQALARTYTTNFDLTENPISEGGSWINAMPMRTSGGVAFGTQTGVESHPPYNDAAAIVAGSWGPDQTAWGTVHTVNQQGGNVYEEVELNIRMTITKDSIWGYDTDFKCSRDGSQYVELGYWKGTPRDIIGVEGTLFKQILGGGVPGLHDGDIIKLSAIGNVVTVYQNGVQLIQVTDTDPRHPKTGAPGIGCYQQGASGVNSDFGLTSFTATDDGATAISATTPHELKPYLSSHTYSTPISVSAQKLYTILGREFTTSMPMPKPVENFIIRHDGSSCTKYPER